MHENNVDMVLISCSLVVALNLVLVPPTYLGRCYAIQQL